MATLTKPLVSVAALASAAAVAVATPAIAPSITAPTPAALTAAKVDLASFATLMSLTADDYINTLFSGYGFTLKANQPEDVDWASSYVGINCNFSCAVNGPSGVAYMALDALINGNDPYTPEKDVKVSALNYFFEGGASPGAQYLVSQPFGDPKSPAYNPAIAQAIALAFQGTYAFTTLYVQGLNTLAATAKTGLPVVGPYVYGAINSYLGPNTQDNVWGDWGYYEGLSGVLRYALDVIATGGNPYPPYGPPVTDSTASLTNLLAGLLPPAAASVAPAPAADAPQAAKLAAGAAVSNDTVSIDTVSNDAPKVEAPASTSADDAAAVKASESAPAEKAEATPEVEAPESAPAAEAKPVAETKPAVEAPEVEAPVEVEAVDTKPAVAPEAPELTVSDIDATDVAEVTEAAEVADTAPAKAPKNPVGDAVEKVTKQISAALGGAQAPAKASAAKADSADSAK